MKPFRFYLGVFLVTASVLMLQIVQSRILSVVLWYYLAFFVVSLAMFGMTAGTIWVYLRRDRFSERTLSHDLAYFSSALAVTTALSVAIQVTLAPAAGRSFTGAVVWFELAACLAVPFFLSGVVISLALTRSPFPIGRVYGVDLAGAAAGCLAVLALLNLTDGPSAVLWVSALAALAALSFAGSGIGAAPAVAMPFARTLLRVKPVLIVLSLAALANGLTPYGLRPIMVKGHLETDRDAPMFTKWNTFSRISVIDRGNSVPYMWGPSPLFRPQDWRIDQRAMQIDGDAATVSYRWDGDIARAGFLKYDVTNLAEYLPGHRSAAIIGVGGGRDILSARVFGVPDITGVEINPILTRLLTEIPGYADYSALGRAPGIHFHVDEARSWFARSDQTFDLIQMSLIDTWAATGAGAFTLTENGLYTVEAWRIFLRHLAPGGVLTVSRWYAADDVNETGRMISLATATLFRLGVSDPRQHIFLAAAGNIATLILSRDPFTAENVALLTSVSAQMRYSVLLSPGGAPASPVLGRIVSSADEADLRQYTAHLPLDLTPPTDERPFFFNQLPLSDPGRLIDLARLNRSEGAAAGNLAAIATLALLFITSVIVVLRTIVYPLAPAIRDLGRRTAFAGSAYFFLIGAGFMSIEIGLVQRMSVFLGHPVYSLSIVLFSLILSTGIGSLVSDRLPLSSRGRFAAWSLLTAAYLFALPSWLPTVLLSFDSASLLVRAAICILAITPAGLLMGYGFPTGMRLVTTIDRTPLPWFWGINGAAGVAASSLGVAVSIAFGIYVTLLTGAFCYALLLPAGLALGFPARTAPAPQLA